MQRLIRDLLTLSALEKLTSRSVTRRLSMWRAALKRYSRRRRLCPPAGVIELECATHAMLARKRKGTLQCLCQPGRQRRALYPGRWAYLHRLAAARFRSGICGEDDGLVLPVHSRLTERFYRVDRDAPETGGTGLGLAIVSTSRAATRAIC